MEVGVTERRGFYSDRGNNGHQPLPITVIVTLTVPRSRFFRINQQETVRNRRARQTWHTGCEGIGIFFRERRRGTRTVTVRVTVMGGRAVSRFFSEAF
jgi:hypothetical protein